MLPSNMLLLNLILLIDVTFSTPTPAYNNLKPLPLPSRKEAFAAHIVDKLKFSDPLGVSAPVSDRHGYLEPPISNTSVMWLPNVPARLSGYLFIRGKIISIIGAGTRCHLAMGRAHPPANSDLFLAGSDTRNQVKFQ